MNGYTLKQSGQKTWNMVYTVVCRGSCIISESKEHYEQGQHLRVALLHRPSIYVGKINDKRLSNIFYIKINFDNNDKSAVTLGYRIEDSRDTWFYAIMTEHAKLFVDRQPDMHPPIKKSRASLRHRRSVSKDIQRERSLSLNLETIKQRPLSRVFNSIFATNRDKNMDQENVISFLPP